jgi:PPOX class probable F420-dependent enzyme
MLSAGELAFIESLRVAHLATADSRGTPHVVPVCFALVGGDFWIPVDEKPKKTIRLKRLRNIEENAQVSLVFDRYSEDWSRLGYLLVTGKAAVVVAGDEHQRVIDALRRRYQQYEAMALEGRPLISVRPVRAVAWGYLTAG